MDIGVSLPLPQDAFGTDILALRDFVQGVEALGFDHLSTYDHVVGTDPGRAGDLPVRYTHRSVFHEPVVLLAWSAALTTRLGLSTGILVSPQRQTVLLAKQAAEVDVLSHGRIRHLGVGVGANPFEYSALGVPFGTRGAVLDEQIPALRALWSQDTVTRSGSGFKLTASGINPRPHRTIPIWVGGASPAAQRRAATMGDGYVLLTSDPSPAATIHRVRGLRVAAGRAGEPFGYQGFLDAVTGGPDDWVRRAEGARAAGVTFLTAMTAHPLLGAGGPMDPAGHIRRVEELARCLLAEGSRP